MYFLSELSQNSRCIIDINHDSNQINLMNPKVRKLRRTKKRNISIFYYFQLEGNQTTHDHRDRMKHFAFDHCYLSINRNDSNYASQQMVNYMKPFLHNLILLNFFFWYFFSRYSMILDLMFWNRLCKVITHVFYAMVKLVLEKHLQWWETQS